MAWTCARSTTTLSPLSAASTWVRIQAFHILPYLTVAQNIALPLALNGIGNKAMHARVGALLDSVRLGERGREPAA